MNFFWAISASVIVSLISLIGIFSILMKQNLLNKILILLVGFSAGGFIYIAACDLIPELHKQPDLKTATSAMGFFLAGIMLMLGFKLIHAH